MITDMIIRQTQIANVQKIDLSEVLFIAISHPEAQIVMHTCLEGINTREKIFAL